MLREEIEVPVSASSFFVRFLLKNPSPHVVSDYDVIGQRLGQHGSSLVLVDSRGLAINAFDFACGGVRNQTRRSQVESNWIPLMAGFEPPFVQV